MTELSGPDAENASASRKAIDDIHALFQGLEETFRHQLNFIRDGDSSFGKPALKKLEEMQSLLVLLLKAEKAFNEKFSANSSEQPTDYTEIRDRIGRKLDRIRESQDTRTIP